MTTNFIKQLETISASVDPEVYPNDSVVGPRGGAVHFVGADLTAYCGRQQPKAGWRYSDDAMNNANTRGFCERCVNAFIPGQNK